MNESVSTRVSRRVLLAAGLICAVFAFASPAVATEGDAVSLSPMTQQTPQVTTLQEPGKAVELPSLEVPGTNYTIATAANLQLNSTKTTTIYGTTQASRLRYYHVKLNKSGKIRWNATSWIKTSSAEYALYDKDGNRIDRWTQQYSREKGYGAFAKTLDLLAGDYYISVGVASVGRGHTGNIRFRLNFTAANETFAEQEGMKINDTVASAKLNAAIPLKQRITGQIAINDPRDIYKVEIPENGKLRISLASWISTYTYFELYYADGTEKVYSNSISKSGTSSNASGYYQFDLTKGTYYLAIHKLGAGGTLRDWNYTDTSNNGNYQFTTYFTPVSDTDYYYHDNNVWYDKNGSTAKATSISPGSYTAQIAVNGDQDYYRISNSKGKATLTVTVTGWLKRIDGFSNPSIVVTVYNGKGSRISGSHYYSVSSVTGKATGKILVSLPSSGSYYLKFESSTDYAGGNYQFTTRIA